MRKTNYVNGQNFRSICIRGKIRIFALSINNVSCYRCLLSLRTRDAGMFRCMHFLGSYLPWRKQFWIRCRTLTYRNACYVRARFPLRLAAASTLTLRGNVLARVFPLFHPRVFKDQLAIFDKCFLASGAPNRSGSRLRSVALPIGGNTGASGILDEYVHSTSVSVSVRERYVRERVRDSAWKLLSSRFRSLPRLTEINRD